MENEFVTYEQALALKELGFDESCIAKYNSWGTLFIREEPEPSEKEVLAPLYQQAFRWFRENKNISGEVYSGDFGGCIEYSFHIRDLYSEKEIFDNFFGAGSSYSGTFNTYEEAEQACLDKLIEIVKNGTRN